MLDSLRVVPISHFAVFNGNHFPSGGVEGLVTVSGLVKYERAGTNSIFRIRSDPVRLFWRRSIEIWYQNCLTEFERVRSILVLTALLPDLNVAKVNRPSIYSAATMRCALLALAVVAAAEAFAPVSVGSAPQVKIAPLAAHVRRRAVSRPLDPSVSLCLRGRMRMYV